LLADNGLLVSLNNVAVVERALAAINTRDLAAYIDLCHSEWELVMPLAPLEGVLRGETGIREFFAGLDEATTAFRLEVENLRPLPGDRVLALIHLVFISERGIDFSQETANVYELERGKLRRVYVYRDRDEAFKAVGITG
jgi:ketosteroid isomerase-like protein